MNKWSVIMLSYLGKQEESADALRAVGERTYSERKFINAVESFIYQDYENKELIIVSDGCEVTNRLYYSCYSSRPDIKLVAMPKSPPPYPPNRYRHAGIVAATGNRICYLDTDDCLFPFHLTNLEDKFPDNVDWICFPYRIMAESILDTSGARTIKLLSEIDLIKASPVTMVSLEVKRGSIGGANIAHKREIKSVWGGDLKHPGRNGDERFIFDLLEKHPNYIKIGSASMGYILCQSQINNHNNNIVEEISKLSPTIVHKFNL